MKQEDHIAKVLSEIQARVPKSLIDNVLIEKKASPNAKKVVELALADPDFPKEKKKHIQLLLNQGYFDKSKFVENPKIVKQIDNFLNREINKAVKAGLLPPRHKAGELPHFRRIYEKVLNQKTK